MPPEHPRAGVAHDGLDLLPQRRLIAMNRAIGTGGYVFLKWAPLQSALNVIPQRRAVRAESGCISVPAFAVKPDHGLDRASFAVEPAGSGGRWGIRGSGFGIQGL